MVTYIGVSSLYLSHSVGSRMTGQNSSQRNPVERWQESKWNLRRKYSLQRGSEKEFDDIKRDAGQSGIIVWNEARRVRFMYSRILAGPNTHQLMGMASRHL